MRYDRLGNINKQKELLERALKINEREYGGELGTLGGVLGLGLVGFQVSRLWEYLLCCLCFWPRPDDAMRTYGSCCAPAKWTEGVRFTASGYSNIPK